MAKTRIVKKRTNTFDRFESHKHVRMGVRLIKPFTKKLIIRDHGEDQEVLIAPSEEDSEDILPSPKSDSVQIILPNICYPTTKKNSL